MMSTTDLGTVVTVVNNEPQEFKVLRKDDYDLANDIPVAYRLDRIRPSDNKLLKRYVFRLSDTLVETYLQQATAVTHTNMIRLAFDMVKRDPFNEVHLLTTDDYEKSQQTTHIHGRSLKQSILQFVYFVNSFWPEKLITAIDLLENIYAELEEIESWLNHLLEAEILVRGGWEKVIIEGTKRQSYKINATKFDDVKTELKTILTSSGKLKVFLSYSHKDKHVAGKVKTELEERGLDVFLAHDDIEVSEEWKERILEELKSCHVFILILSANFEASDWTDQETGHAFANQKVIVPLNLTCNPYGFIGKYQAKPLDENSVSESCQAIIEALAKKPELASFFNRELVK